jgi:hypothetical protein
MADADLLALDSDYDLVRAKFVENRMEPDFHSTAMGVCLGCPQLGTQPHVQHAGQLLRAG